MASRVKSSAFNEGEVPALAGQNRESERGEPQERADAFRKNRILIYAAAIIISNSSRSIVSFSIKRSAISLSFFRRWEIIFFAVL